MYVCMYVCTWLEQVFPLLDGGRCRDRRRGVHTDHGVRRSGDVGVARRRAVCRRRVRVDRRWRRHPRHLIHRLLRRLRREQVYPRLCELVFWLLLLYPSIHFDFSLFPLSITVFLSPSSIIFVPLFSIDIL